MSPLLPSLLAPTSTELTILPFGREVKIPKTTPLFRRWISQMPADSFGHMPVLELNGKMVFAELAILRIFQEAGWSGRWVDSFHRRYLTEYWPKPVSEGLPEKQQTLLDGIGAKAGGSGGCFDVFCWRNEEIMFAESKWRDRILETQAKWLEAALDSGISAESFLIVQWRFDES
jgi:hypothetical protein